MKSTALILLTALSVTLCGCARYNQPPKTMMIEQAFFACSKCGSLDGGVYGKGPVKSFWTKAASHCIHDWQPISKGEFEFLATERFGVDWSKEIPYWSERTAAKTSAGPTGARTDGEDSSKGKPTP